MCGVAGILAYAGQGFVQPWQVEQMTGQIVHRGPDDAGVFCDGVAGLGVRRLSIIDVEGGHQPMTNEDCSVFVVSNG